MITLEDWEGESTTIVVNNYTISNESDKLVNTFSSIYNRYSYKIISIGQNQLLLAG